MGIEAKLDRAWYEGERAPLWSWLLMPVFRVVVLLRRFLYRIGILSSHRLPVPVVVIGNITVGGTGKTPLAIALIDALRGRDIQCGIISRGYGGKTQRTPVPVQPESDVGQSGDEALMMAKRTRAPVCVHPRRVLAGEYLLSKADVDVILCDDGLQHYALARDIEIAVIDGERGLGNGRMLPAGPLREPVRRLRGVDHIVVNGDAEAMANRIGASFRSNMTGMRLVPSALVNLATGERRSPDALVTERCAAIAGIGNPQRFFRALGELGYSAECRAFPDHHPFSEGDLAFSEKRPVLMTEKDAVKCRAFARPDWWYLEVGAALEPEFVERLGDELDALLKRSE